MWSLETIQYLNKQARNKNQSNILVLKNPTDAELNAIADAGGDKQAPQSFLNRNDEIEELFVDTSGFGSYSEPALTQDQFSECLKQIISKHGSICIGIKEFGQFQCNIGVWPLTN